MESSSPTVSSFQVSRRSIATATYGSRQQVPSGLSLSLRLRELGYPKRSRHPRATSCVVKRCHATATSGLHRSWRWCTNGVESRRGILVGLHALRRLLDGLPPLRDEGDRQFVVVVA